MQSFANNRTHHPIHHQICDMIGSQVHYPAVHVHFRRFVHRSIRSMLACAISTALLQPALVAAAPSVPVAPAVSADSPLWITGGVTKDERAMLQTQAEQYSLWLITAVQPGGAYLSDVHISIRDEQGQLRLDQLLDGPWLMVQLPPGRYEVIGTISGQRQARHIQIREGARNKVYLHFKP